MALTQDKMDSIPGLTATDRENLAQGDEKFQPHTWIELKRIIADNDLAILKRKPSDLRRYAIWSSQTKAEYGSITKFVCGKRLHWKPISDSPETGPVFECNSSKPFANSADYMIRSNDWPYGISPEIAHIVVWSKVQIPDEQPEGDLTVASRRLIQKFVRETFIDKLATAGFEDAGDRVLWFRNWAKLQSVQGLEHIHVLVLDAPEKLLEAWTGRTKPDL